MVQEIRSQSVFVVEEVARPGTPRPPGPHDDGEVLAKAGPTQNAGNEVVIVRPRTHVEGFSGRIRVVREVDGKTPELKVKLDYPLQPGKTIVVESKLF